MHFMKMEKTGIYDYYAYVHKDRLIYVGKVGRRWTAEAFDLDTGDDGIGSVRSTLIVETADTRAAAAEAVLARMNAPKRETSSLQRINRRLHAFLYASTSFYPLRGA